MTRDDAPTRPGKPDDRERWALVEVACVCGRSHNAIVPARAVRAWQSALIQACPNAEPEPEESP